MDHFHYHSNQLFVEDLPIEHIHKQFGSPCYVYSKATLLHHYQIFKEALAAQPHQICFSVKANSNISILNALANQGSGFDIVSVGELFRVLKAEGDPNKIIFSGVAKQEFELEEALKCNIHCFNVESEDEVNKLNSIASRLNTQAPISFRVNPDINAQSHPYISTGLKENKFGIPIDEAMTLYRKAAQLPHIKIIGIASHIGSQLLSLTPFVELAKKLIALKNQLESIGVPIQHLDFGGGLGVQYKDETPPQPSEYAQAIINEINDKQLKIIIEPGRAIAANAGVLLTQVILLKNNGDKHFCIVDAGMNDYLRPALYNSEQRIVAVQLKDHPEQTFDVVGPVCETGDFLGKAIKLKVAAKDLLVVRGCGAYGFTMSSNYNSRPRPPEILVDGTKAVCIRSRETFEDLIRKELIPEKSTVFSNKTA